MVRNLLVQLEKIRKLNNNVLFERIYISILCLITGLFWVLGESKVVPAYTGLMSICIITGISMLLFNKFKYFIPGTLMLIFANPEGYKSNEFPLSIVVCGFIMIGVLIVYTIFNYKNITFKNKDKSFYALVYLGIFSFLPLTYYNLLDDTVSTLIWIYFSYLLYSGIYIFFLANSDETSWSTIKSSMQAMAFLIATQCFFKVYFMHLADANKPILDMWYYLGWGLCNEAGIMLCFALPFIFMDLNKDNKVCDYIFFGLKFIVIIIGMILTTSRGTYLFGGILSVLLFIYTIIRNKNRLPILLTMLIIGMIVIVLIHLLFGLSRIIEDIGKFVFNHGLDNNGRYVLFDNAVRFYKTSPLTMLFGTGFVAERALVLTQAGFQDGYWVYHSTFFETLCCFGFFGLLALIHHFYQKYKQLLKLNRYDAIILLLGYLMVDLYGMIDNSYSFYYYMIPLVIVMAGLDALKPVEAQEKKEVEALA